MNACVPSGRAPHQTPGYSACLVRALTACLQEFKVLEHLFYGLKVPKLDAKQLRPMKIALMSLGTRFATWRSWVLKTESPTHCQTLPHSVCFSETS